MLAGLALLKSDRVASFVGSAAGRLLHLVRRSIAVEAVHDRVIDQRDAVAAAFAGHWARALASAAGNRMFDYAALVAAVHAVGGEARPSMVLLAYVLSLALAWFPSPLVGWDSWRPGSTSILVLAGVDADAAVLSTLLYRTFQFWLPIPLGALAWAGWRLHGTVTRPEQTGDGSAVSPPGS